MKDRIIFDTTDAGTIADSDKILSGLISSDGSTLITDTLEGGKQGLDVYLINASLDVVAGAEHAEDDAHVSGDTGNFVLAVRNDVEGSLVSADGDYAPLQVDASGRLRVIADLDVSNLAEKAEDDAHVSGDIGNYVLTVREDTLSTSTSADGDYQSFKTNANGELYVKDTDVLARLVTMNGVLDDISVDTGNIATSVDNIDTSTAAIAISVDNIDTNTGNIDTTLAGLSHLEDDAHVSGDAGIQALAVRQDTLANSTSADGDYASLKVNVNGALYVKHDGDLDVSDIANTDLANTATTVGVAATDLVGTDLAARKFAYVYNNGNKTGFIGDSSVTTANGFPLSPGSYLELRIGAAIDLYAISTSAGQDFRILELS